MSSEILAVLNDIRSEIRIIRMKIEAIEELLGEEMSEEDKKALEEALEEHRRGLTIPLGEIEREIEAKS